MEHKHIHVIQRFKTAVHLEENIFLNNEEAPGSAKGRWLSQQWKPRLAQMTPECSSATDVRWKLNELKLLKTSNFLN